MRRLHRAKCPAILLKLDIAKAFDTVSWEFLLELLRHLGYGVKWHDCIAVLLVSSSTTVCINGRDTQRIRLARGLRQGDPLSPLLFVLVMETFAALCATAANRGALSPLAGGVLPLRALLYADDAIVFFHPSTQDASTISHFAQVYGGCNWFGLELREKFHHAHTLLGRTTCGCDLSAGVPGAVAPHRLSWTSSFSAQAGKSGPAANDGSSC